MADPGFVVYTALMMAVAVGMTAWRFAAAEGRVGTQVDGMLGGCLLTSAALFVSAVLPGTQLP